MASQVLTVRNDRPGIKRILDAIPVRLQKERAALVEQCHVIYDVWKRCEKNSQDYASSSNSLKEQIEQARIDVLKRGAALIQPCQALRKKLDELEGSLRLISEKINAQKNRENGKNSTTPEMRTLIQQHNSLEKQKIILKQQIHSLNARNNRRLREFRYKVNLINCMEKSPKIRSYADRSAEDLIKVRMQGEKIQEIVTTCKDLDLLHRELSQIYNGNWVNGQWIG